MISMPGIQSIRQLRRNAESIASIARKVGAGEPTVRKYLEAGDLSPKPPVRKRRASAIDEYVPAIEQWLAEDRETWHKQRHTATRVRERLRDEKGAEVSLSTVTKTVARLRREFAVFCQALVCRFTVGGCPGYRSIVYRVTGQLFTGLPSAGFVWFWLFCYCMRAWVLR